MGTKNQTAMWHSKKIIIIIIKIIIITSNFFYKTHKSLCHLTALITTGGGQGEVNPFETAHHMLPKVKQ